MSTYHRKLLLASGSPRRKELLSFLGHPFDIVVPDIEEQQQKNEIASDYVCRLSREKAQAGLQLSHDENTVVIGSDTIVVVDGEVLEKPLDCEHSIQMLTRLSNRQHQVMTAVTVKDRDTSQTVLVETQVWFKTLSRQEMINYWQTGEPCDKAGSYGIQGIGGRFVARIDGSYHAVVGLPLMETDQLLQNFIK
ncbi:Maf family protein [Vibrio tapetis]|uniref:dTTP/UTP pyrophosphatase n=1 Tax=Vibrio tapetis subsp. tapetis TaxID=1671868 RepID=A0A2N8ZFK2_9VIBR|nr:Maf family protein [Vibrio tapetis]SON50670.1 putative septum formation protein [Vibrio tapetis subsp. tapetis]